MAPDSIERIEWSRPFELPGVELLLAERCTRRWRVFHETYTVCTILDISGGETEWTYRAKLHSSKARALMLMEPGEVHAMPHTIPPCDFRVLLIAPGVVEGAALELGIPALQPHWMSGHSGDPASFRSFAGLHASLESPASELERQSRFVACLRLLLERCSETGSPSPKPPEPKVLLRARDFIREHCSRPIGLAELAAVSGLSRFHLVRAFATAFGVPPHAYQIRVQITRARTLLGAGVPPAEVAAETGFCDQSHFARHFKRVYGVTPGRYQEGLRPR
ncbi:MAG: helix-turn-helix domain-containing protein [Vicinamibacterales bacterium]